ILGLSITSSWGNGHATTFRGLVKELTKNGHDVTFLERDVPWYATSRDMPKPQFCKTYLYQSLEDLKERFQTEVREADLVMVGSYVPQGVEVIKWVIKTAKGITSFYDIDTPVTLAKLERKDYEYLQPELISKFDLYLSFTGGPTLDLLEKKYGSPMARAFYCSFDPKLYYTEPSEKAWDLGYLGTYSADRQPPLEKLMLEPARRLQKGKFIVAGPLYPSEIIWPENVEYVSHVAPAEHRSFYNAQWFTLNITREDMVKAGYSPSVRLFEAAACGTAIISDYWEGIETIFDTSSEILISRSPKDTLQYLKEMSPKEIRTVGEKAQKKVLANHTAAHRAIELENHCLQLMNKNVPTLA
ncbi:MAG TPA: glycosyltransferase, partial [Cytophagaceae bacterium]